MELKHLAFVEEILAWVAVVRLVFSVLRLLDCGYSAGWKARRNPRLVLKRLERRVIGVNEVYGGRSRVPIASFLVVLCRFKSQHKVSLSLARPNSR